MIKGKRKVISIAIIGSIVLSFSLSFQDEEQCLVPNSKIQRELPKDMIKAIDNPTYLTISEFENQFTRSELKTLYVLGIVINGESYAYPRDVLDWHEIVNENIHEQPLSVTYCPLTGSGVVYNTTALSGSTLGTSGNLYENNLVFYDRDSDSSWSQMLNLAIKGAKIGQYLDILPITETTWSAWKSLHPDTVVLARETKVFFDLKRYDMSPYQDYRYEPEIWFQTSYNPEIPPYNMYFEKELTLIMTEHQNELKQPIVQLYPFDELAEKTVWNDLIGNQSFVIIFDKENQLAIPFNSTLSESVTNESTFFFSPHNGSGIDSKLTLSLPVFQDHQTGTIWNMRGEAISGELEGISQLQHLPSYNAFWFAATVFFPNAEIYTVNTTISYPLIENPIIDQNESQVENYTFQIGFSLVSNLSVSLIAIFYLQKKKKS